MVVDHLGCGAIGWLLSAVVSLFASLLCHWLHSFLYGLVGLLYQQLLEGYTHMALYCPYTKATAVPTRQYWAIWDIWYALVIHMVRYTHPLYTCSSPY